MVQVGKVTLNVFTAEGKLGAVLGSLLAVARAMSIDGIAKDRRNDAQRFQFRGIDDVLNALSPQWVLNDLLVVPSLVSTEQTERKNDKGTVLMFVNVVMDYTFVSTVDGTNVVVRMPGQAMDSGDKAMNKAISVAYKYTAIQLLSIPIEGTPEDRDPDFTTHKVVEREPAPRVKQEDQPTKKAEPKNEPVEPDTVQYAIERMTANPTAQTKLTELLLKAYSVMTLDQIPEDKIQEAIGQAQTCLEAQRKNAAKKK